MCPTLIVTRPSHAEANNPNPKQAEDKYISYLKHLERSSEYYTKLHCLTPNSKSHKSKTPDEKQSSNAAQKHPKTTLESYAQTYTDYLQVPLQPLQDHLGSVVYENFERDSVKYAKYEEVSLQVICVRKSCLSRWIEL